MLSASTAIDLHLPARLPWQERLAKVVHGGARFIVAVMGRRAGKTTALADLAGEWALDRKGVVSLVMNGHRFVYYPHSLRTLRAALGRTHDLKVVYTPKIADGIPPFYVCLYGKW